MIQRLAWYLSCFILCVLVVISTWWLQQHDEKEFLSVRASMEPDLALPIYAQFTVTQRFTLPTPIALTKLEVPMYFNHTTEPLQIDLYREKKLVSRWRIDPQRYAQESIVWVTLPLTPAQYTDDIFDVTFAAPRINHDHREHAPRLFVETADDAYPLGNYRIAENEKKGDIGFKVFYRQQRLDSYLAQFSQRPELAIVEATRWALLALLLITFPPSVARIWEYTNRRTTARTE